MLHIEFGDSVATFPTAEWDALAGSDPFLAHAFLRALETTGCVGPGTGWHPVPLGVRDDGGALMGAAPLYLKDHSFGEYVFDWGWAGAAERAGLDYYPKLVAAVPFSPVTGARMLVADHADAGAVRERLMAGAMELAERYRCGAVQWLFPRRSDLGPLEEAGYLGRRDVQFHWYNRGYADFEDFLGEFSSSKRKQARKERRRAEETGLEIAVRQGGEVSPEEWAAFHEGYMVTTEMRGAPAYLNRAFFEELGRLLGDRVVLVGAYREGALVAGALNLRSDTALYGRYWSALEEHDFLHFEVCFYRGIDYAIEHGLERFEGGAQGEHKVKRGFVPTITASAHWVDHPGLRNAVSEFLERETPQVRAYAKQAAGHLPFKEGRNPGVMEGP
ncbi:GNAT family N-acetyltransferase [Thiohalorhabdus sp. Cl-TMA]|uniref:GNAT family N-acetyltransferase n=1 Tax=Thiohalorhabdus methylotrophus TaxID=3242694 RepID=A0ABV4TSR7_9GAMM